MKNQISKLILVFSLCCFFPLFANSESNMSSTGQQGRTFPSPMLQEIYDLGDPAKTKGKYFDVTAIVEKYVPLGSTPEEVTQILRKNSIGSIQKATDGRRFDPADFTDRDYYVFYTYQAGSFLHANFSNRALRILFYFSESNKLIKIEAVYYYITL